MSTYSLDPHPLFPPPVGFGVEVDVEPLGAGLLLTYRFRGHHRHVRIQPPRDGGRHDQLWQHTCFEAFVRAGDAPGYTELNFAPAGEWAAYLFDGYREGMRDRPGARGPTAVTDAPWPASQGDREWSLWTEDLPDSSLEWRVGLAAVIEAQDGTKSYWSLGHPDGPPDFHDPTCFALAFLAPPRA